MQAVIMAAGKSTRTYPLTVTKPKPLLKAANKTILEHNLEQLQGIVEEAIIVVGFKGDLLKKLGDKSGSVKLTYIEQKSLNGTGSALLAAKDLLKDRFIVMNGDDFFSGKDIKRCLKYRYCILVKYVDDLSRFGEVIYDEHGVKALKEKPGKKEGLANTGLYVLDKKVFDISLKKSARGEYEITDYIAKLDKVHYVRVEDYWLPVTYPWNLLEANEFFLANIVSSKAGKIEKGSVIKGPVIIGRNTLIRSGTYIEGHVSIGENCIIGPNCYIRGSTSIGNGSKIGNAVEVKNSIIGDKTSVSHLSYIGDSVIGDNVNIAAGTITANLRHDHNTVRTPVKGEMIDTGRIKLGAIIGDNVSTGINTSIYPGRKIWPGMTTLPAEIVKKDVGGW